MMNKIMTLIWVIIMCITVIIFIYGAITLDTYYIKVGLSTFFFSMFSTVVLHYKHGASNFIGIFIHGMLCIMSLAKFFGYMATEDAANALIFLGISVLLAFTLAGIKLENG